MDAESLLDMLRSAGLGPTSPADFIDAAVTQLPPGSSSIATSVDLIFDFGLPPADLGWVAAVHALSDLYAVLATPLVATTCMGVSGRWLRDGSAAQTLAGVVGALQSTGTSMGGGHTVYNDPSFVGVTVVGINARGDRATLMPGHSYELFLSKPIGSGLYIAAMRNGLLDERSQKELRSTIRSSNAGAAESLSTLLDDDEEGIGFVTDVTGFGLIVAIRSRLSPGWQATLATSEIPLLQNARSMLTEHGLATRLGDRNSLMAHGDGSFELTGVDMVTRLLVNDPQTSGGLVAAVRADVSANLVQGSFRSWEHIGSVQQALDTDDIRTVILQ